MKIKKEHRKISIENAELIGEGFFSKVYRLDLETIVKVYIKDTSLEDIERELSFAKQAIIKGIPTAISYDVVDVDGITDRFLNQEGILHDVKIAFDCIYGEITLLDGLKGILQFERIDQSTNT